MTGRIIITGDKHQALRSLFGLAEKNQLTAADVLIIAGDAGYIWDENYPYTVKTLQQIFPGTLAFIDGNHENHVLLNSLPVQQWNGGAVHAAGERVFHLMRGEIYSIYGNKIFAFGGARSTDKNEWRDDGISWWKEEEPSPEELAYGENRLTSRLQEIDYVITHETPLLARASFSRTKPIDPDYLLPAVFDRWYQAVSAAPNFKRWYFGHMHADQLINPRLQAVYTSFWLLGGETRLPWV